MVGSLRHALHRLKPLTLRRATAPGYLGDGGGLYLQITKSGARSWIFRYSLSGQRREMGLGAFSRARTDDPPPVSLATARKLAAEKRALVAEGTDPIAARDAERARRRLQQARGVTWVKAVDQFLTAHEATWRNAKHRQQWRNTLTAYASPAFEGLSVGSIGTPEVIKVLDGIWQEKPATASRGPGPYRAGVDWAKVRGYREGENPARWRGHLDKVFPTKSKVKRVKHHPAVGIDNAPAVYARLCKADGMAALALRFVILTAGRAGEILGARWSEIDLQAAIWTVPGTRMKAGQVHRTPLSREALAVLKVATKYRVNDRVFPSSRRGQPISSSSLLKVLQAVGGDATVHGFRSTFRDWCSERTSFPREVSEMALAHTIENPAEAAYRRGELMQKRAALMQQWATFVRTPSGSGTVTLLRRRR